MLIRVVPVGDPSERVLNILCSQLENMLNTRCRLLNKIGVPAHSHNQWRKQYNAEIIMEEVVNIPEVKFIDKEIPTVMVTDEDIYYKGLNFAFSLEDPSKNCCILSTARLRPEFYDERPSEELVAQRLVKEAIHEIGHFRGLEHCSVLKCVMAFSPSVNDIDKKGKEFCERCKVKMMTRGIEF